MKSLRVLVVVLSCAVVAALGVMSAQQNPVTDIAPDGFAKIVSALPYLSSHVPEQRLQAEQIIEQNAEEYFEQLLKKLDDQPRAGRETLLRILANTEHEGRVKLCMDTLCNHEARRSERIIAATALRDADSSALLKLVEKRLSEPELSAYQRVQCCGLLGTIPTARAQGVAESVLDSADGGSLLAFFAEDAVLRSTIATPFAQPAWGRYQTRHENAPKINLATLQDMLEDLAQPRAADRAVAESALQKVVGDDARVLLALSRSLWPERAGFALKRLENERARGFGQATQAVMLDLVTTGGQTVALMAMDVAIAGTPPSDSEMEALRPMVSADSASRLEAIIEGMSRGANLAELRDEHERLRATLRPLLLRRSAFDPEVKELLGSMGSLHARLQRLEFEWAGGWRREFRTEILGASPG